MRVKQLGQIISWLTILATATLINAEHKYSRKYHDPCPGRSFQVEPYLYGINLALQDGLSSIGGSTDIYLKFKIADVLKEDSGAKGFWDKLRDKDIDDDYERPNRYDPLIMCCEKNQRDCQLNMRMESILDIEDIKDDVRFKKVDKSGGSEEKVKKVLRDGQGLTILIHFKSKFDPGYHGKLSIVYTRHSGAIRHGISESLKASLVSQRFQRDRLNELFPFFNKLESSSSKYEVTIRYPDANGNVFVSNFDRDAYYENKLSHSSRASTGMKETRFKDLRLNDVQELTFAVGPFYRTKIDNRLMKHPTILPQTGSEVLQGFAKRFLEQTLDWLRNYSPANWDDDIDSRIVTGYQFIAIVPQLTNVGPTSPEPTVETALTVALRTARKWLSVFNARYIDSSWIIDGLAVHFAIRMVRELEPHLRVDEYVRSTHLAWLIEHEINGHYNDLNVVHSYKYQADGPLEDVWLRRIKFGTFVDMIERNLCRDQQAFDEAVLDLLKDSGSEEITDRKLEERISGEESENFVVWAWAWSVGFPQIGVSLDKKNKSIKLTQVPMIWLYGRGEGKRWIPAWRMSITVKFSNGTKPEQTVHVPMSGGFDGKHDSLIIPLPEWFNYDEPGHKVWLDIQDQEELPYYQVSYSSDLKIKLQDS